MGKAVYLLLGFLKVVRSVASAEVVSSVASAEVVSSQQCR